MRVVCEFGRRKIVGLAIEVSEQPPPGLEPSRVKPLLAVLDSEPAIPHELLTMDAAEGRTSVNRLILQRIAWGDQPPSEPQPSLTLEAKAEHKPRKTTKADKRKLTA